MMTDGGFSFSIHQDAIFLICGHDLDRPLATGFCFIKPEWIVTTKHAVIDLDLPREELWLLPRHGAPLTGSIVFVHPTHDLAVLRIEGPSPCDVPLFPSFEEYTGLKGLLACGYAPSLSSVEESRYTLHLNHVPSYEREKRIRDTGEEALITFDAPWMEGGHSGGPVFGEGGGVVAVLIEKVQNNDGLVSARATSILHLLRFLTFR